MHNEIKIHDNVFNFLFEMAINDALNRVSNSGDKEKIKKQDKIRDIVKQHAEAVINGKEYAVIKTAKLIIEINNESKDKVEGLSFGKLQKLINMTMKYLYIIYYDRHEIRKKFVDCDAPMDDAMRDFVYWSYCNLPGKKGSEIFFNRYTAWSKLKIECNGEEDKCYRSFQNAINCIITNKKLNISPMEFDFVFWDKSKELLDKNLDKQKEIVNRIWENYEGEKQ